MSEITFSVVVPLYNKAAYIKRALASVYSQTLYPKELIIIDDFSTDNSFHVAEQYIKSKQQSHPNIAVRTIRNERNMGPGAARNRGLNVATSDFVLFLDADDEYQPKLLCNISKLAVQGKAKVVIFGYHRRPEDRLMPNPDCLLNSGSLPHWLSPFDSHACELNQPLGFVNDRHYPVGPGSNVAVHRDMIKTIRYDESAHVYEGIDFWFRVIRHAAHKQGKIYYLIKAFHTVYSVPESLIRKPLQFCDIEHPVILKRYRNSTDPHERQLHNRIAKAWFKNTLQRLSRRTAKLRFVWRYKTYLWLAYRQ